MQDPNSPIVLDIGATADIGTLHQIMNEADADLRSAKTDIEQQFAAFRDEPGSMTWEAMVIAAETYRRCHEFAASARANFNTAGDRENAIADMD